MKKLQHIFLTLILLATLGVGTVWGAKGFKGPWCMQYYYTGSSNTWISDQSSGATYNLGVMSTFYLKGCWVQTYSNDNWTTSNMKWEYGYTGLSASGNYILYEDHKNQDPGYWTYDNKVDFNVIANAPNSVGQNTLWMRWTLDDGYATSATCYVNFTIPGFTITSTSQTFDATAPNSTNDKTISFGQHYGTALTTSRCSLSGTNSSEFEVRSITETGVTVRFKPSSHGSKSATLTITDAHSKTCTISLSGKTKYTVTYNKGTYGTGSNQTAYKIYGTTLTLADKGYFTRTGYNQSAWNTNSNGTSGTSYALKGSYTSNAAITLYPTWTAKTYTITLNKNGGSGSTAANVTATYNSSSLSASITNPTRAGYTFNGWHKGSGSGQLIIDTDGVLQASTDYTGAGGIWTNDGGVTLYAGWTAKTYTISFSQSGTGYGSGGQTATKTATYGSAMPTTISVPTAANGYAFMGYYDALEPLGTQYYTATGASARTWNKTSNTTLYAYFKKADITDITLNQEAFVPVDAEAAATYVQANPVISPTPVEPTIVCWELLYSNNNPVPDKDPIADTGGGSYPRRVKFSINGLAAGTYKIKATLRTGSSCPDGGTILSVYTQNFRIASSHTLDIQYICDDEILSTGSVEVPALGTQSITAPTHTTDVNSPFFGYSFHHWELPDGVTCTSGSTGNANTKGSQTISVSATYEGTIKVYYTHRGMIFFKKPGDWSGTSTVYYYNIGSASKWKDSGDGKYGLYTNSITYGGQAMTRIGTSNIYYYDFEGTAATGDDPGQYIAFSNQLQNGYEPMTGCQVSWPIEYTQGYSAGTPMFVCVNYNYHTWLANYYNGGYWTKFHKDWTKNDYPGYTLKIYNQKAKDGRVELKSIPFTSSSEDMSYKAVVELEAGQTYGFKFVRDDNIWYKNDNDGTMTYTSRDAWPFVYDGSDGSACGITTTATGNYTFTLQYYNNTHNMRITVDYPVSGGDYRLIYKDNNHTKWHPSATIAKQNNHKDTVSFFVRKDQNPKLYIQYATVNGSTGAVTWTTTGSNLLSSIPSVISSKDDYGVFNFNMQTNGSGTMSLQSVDEYTGDFYIRVDAANNKWDSYQAADHLMTYTEFSESNANVSGPKYSHYFCAWCPRGRNVKFTVANDYSPCISDTLIQDATFNNIDVNGNLLNAGGDETSDRYSANIRFMWNRKTNYIGRAYVASSTNTAKRFLVLVCGDTKMHDADNNAIPATANLEANAVLLQDDQNWIYETVVKVLPTARVRLYASYAQASPSANGAQYFRGSYNASFTDANTIQLLGGSGSQYYLMRVIYDFKTNRLITAWLPDGTDIEGNPLNIDADVMVIRDHQQAAEAITFHSSSDKLGQVKTVYGTMRFNRWTLNNRARGKNGEEDFVKEHCNTTAAISEYHPLLDEGDQLSSFERNTYFISFPFDVQLSEVFGFGNYGEHWIISKYNGLRRAQVGYFYDNCINGDFDCTNWDFIWDRSGETLNAYEGYLLSLDLDKMKYDDTTKFWLKQIQQVELYFPSKVPMSTITTTNVEMPALGTEYQCTKNFNTEGTNPEGDRRVKDSYWRCIGVPSYATYGTVLKDGDGNNISWQKNYSWDVNPNNLPFLYEWNTTDNTLTPQVTSTYSFKPLHSYLVQCKSKIKWTAVSATPASIVRRQRAETKSEYTWRLHLAGDNNDESDTYIRMTDDEEVTEDFDFGPDMIKKFRDGYIVDANGDPIWDSSIDDYKQGVLHSDIYSMLGYEYLAANSMPLNTTSTTIVPVGIRLKKAGIYTIALPDGAFGVGITLVDNNNGERTNLSAGLEYQFYAEAGQEDNRFHLEIAPIKQVPTGLEPTSDSSLEGRAQKRLIDGKLYILRDGKVYDARGNKVE